MHTCTIALSVYSRSPAAYEALKGFGILQLPGISSLKSYSSFNLENPGVCEEGLAVARGQYQQIIDEKPTAVRVPNWEGILIFDEAKVGLKIHHHTKTGNFIGLAKLSEELGSLHDVFQTLKPGHRTQKASYVLQYLWRCTVSNFDILGPYYTSVEAMKAKLILSTLFDAMYAFQLYGFKTKAIICDGASTNLSAIKVLTGFGSGAYGHKEEEGVEDVQEVQACFTNPFTNGKVYAVICPSHQVYDLTMLSLFLF